MSLRRGLAFGILAACLALAAVPSTADEAEPCRAPLQRWTQVELYLGRDVADGPDVTERQFRRFLAETVTPLFPSGLSVIDVRGQYLMGPAIIREKAKLLLLVVPDTAEADEEVTAIVEAYKSRFRQESVLRIESPVCLSFD